MVGSSEIERQPSNVSLWLDCNLLTDNRNLHRNKLTIDWESEGTDDGEELLEGLDVSVYKGVGMFDVVGSTEGTAVNASDAFLNE
jgi:hypothetical protein